MKVFIIVLGCLLFLSGCVFDVVEDQVFLSGDYVLNVSSNPAFVNNSVVCTLDNTCFYNFSTSLLSSNNFWLGVNYFLNDVFVTNLAILDVNNSLVVRNLDNSVHANITGGSSQGTGQSVFYGKVGIGTLTPSEDLHVYGAGTQRVAVQSTTGQSAIKLNNPYGQGFFYLPANSGNFTFNSNDYIVIDPADDLIVKDLTYFEDNVGIGVSNPSQSLEVLGGNGNIVSTNSGGSAMFSDTSGRGGAIDFNGNTASIGISSDGTYQGYDYDGAFIFKQKASNPDAEGEFIFIEESGDWRFALPKSANNIGTYNARSLIVAGPSVNNGSNFNCGFWGFDSIDCNTSSTGADLGVQDDLQVLGNTYVGGHVIVDGDGSSTPVLTFTGSTNVGIGLGLNDELELITSGANWFTMDENGSVALGIVDPLARLHIYNSNVPQSVVKDYADELVLENELNTGLSIYSGNTNKGTIAFIDGGTKDFGEINYNHSALEMRFLTSDTETLVLEVGESYFNSQLGIDIKNPVYDLDVNGTFRVSGTPYFESTINLTNYLLDQDKGLGVPLNYMAFHSLFDTDAGMGFYAGGVGARVTMLDTSGAEAFNFQVIDSVMYIRPIASAPATCTEGEIYTDTSGAICYCYTANTWDRMNSQGTCT